MNEEAGAPTPEPTPPEPQTRTPPPSQAGNFRDRFSAPSGGLPPVLRRVLPLVVLALVPAIIVGVLVFVLKGGGGGGSNNRSAGVVDGFIRLGQSDQGTVNSFLGKLPQGFPNDFPRYSGSRIVASFTINSDQNGTSYFVIFDTADTVDKVLAYYQKILDVDPYQITVARSSEDFSGLRFTRPDNADIEGDVSVHHSELDNRTSIFLSYQDNGATGQAQSSQKFTLKPSRALPAGFPADFPMYQGSGKSTVTETFFQRASGNTSFIVTYITKDDQDKVMSFYKQEFQKRGWQVSDSQQQTSGFATAIDFTDSKKQYQGTIRADQFDQDSSYTRVDVLVQVSPSSSRGN